MADAAAGKHPGKSPDGGAVPPERSHKNTDKHTPTTASQALRNGGPSWSWLGIPVMIPKDHQGAESDAINKRAISMLAWALSHSRRQHGGRERISPSPGVLFRSVMSLPRLTLIGPSGLNSKDWGRPAGLVPSHTLLDIGCGPILPIIQKQN
uniref:Uncharacterized protein n=1 Tax=Pipistrellus kuhlii TaxID=59472 RepID=A0A7J7ZJE3_PIPKU|nr:hypothetical protein mPipKuh1_009487 [Pipistrellus kuhlii]